MGFDCTPTRPESLAPCQSNFKQDVTTPDHALIYINGDQNFESFSTLSTCAVENGLFSTAQVEIWLGGGGDDEVGIPEQLQFAGGIEIKMLHHDPAGIPRRSIPEIGRQ